MKKLLKVALVAVSMMFVGNLANAQAKIGHIAFDELVGQMPEAKTVQTTMTAFQKDWEDQYQNLGAELNKKGKEYQDQLKTMSDAVKASKEAELQDMQNRLTQLQEKARQAITAKQEELTKPLIEKVRTAVANVAKEKGYTYVLNSSQTDLIVAPEGDNLLAAVKLKLGIK